MRPLCAFHVLQDITMTDKSAQAELNSRRALASAPSHMRSYVSIPVLRQSNASDDSRRCSGGHVVDHYLRVELAGVSGGGLTRILQSQFVVVNSRKPACDCAPSDTCEACV